jgi:hypothetical protein
VVLRLHLKGLASFRTSNSKVMVDAAVSSQDGKPKVRLWQDGKENAPLDEKSPLWTDIRIVGGDGQPARELPLSVGRLPAALRAQCRFRRHGVSDGLRLGRQRHGRHEKKPGGQNQRRGGGVTANGISGHRKN